MKTLQTVMCVGRKFSVVAAKEKKKKRTEAQTPWHRSEVTGRVLPKDQRIVR